MRTLLLMESLRIEPLLPEHREDVARIYAEGIATGQATFEIEVPSWNTWDRGHLPGHRFVAVRGDAVVGWAALSLVSRRVVYRGVAEDGIYVADSAREQGVGRALLEALVTSAERAGIWTVQAAIFPENVASIRLHEGTGFRVVGRRERLAQLAGVWRDVLLLERRSPTI